MTQKEVEPFGEKVQPIGSFSRGLAHLPYLKLAQLFRKHGEQIDISGDNKGNVNVQGSSHAKRLFLEACGWGAFMAVVSLMSSGHIGNPGGQILTRREEETLGSIKGYLQELREGGPDKKRKIVRGIEAGLTSLFETKIRRN